MLYSIIICTRNRADVLEKVLPNHLKLNRPSGVELELIVVDNGSTDRTEQVVGAFADTADFTVRYLRESRQGHSVALNAGCRLSAGEVLAFTDDDAIPDAQWLQAIHEALQIQGNDWVFGPVHPLWSGKVVPKWYGPETASLVACLNYGNRPYVSTDKQLSFAGVNHACLRKRIYELGLYDEKLGLIGERSTNGNDDDLYVRGLQKGFKIFYSPEMSVNHMIAVHREGKALHRRNAYLVGRNQAMLPQDPSVGRTLFAVPLYVYGLIVHHAYQSALNGVMGRRSAAFYHQLRSIRFLTFLLVRCKSWFVGLVSRR